jgi:hypothetical protein
LWKQPRPALWTRIGKLEFAVSVVGIALVGALLGQDLYQQSPSEFQSARQGLQAQQNAKLDTDPVDTVTLSGQGNAPQFLSGISTFSRYLQQDEVATAAAAYQSIQRDVQQQVQLSGFAQTEAPLPPALIVAMWQGQENISQDNAYAETETPSPTLDIQG